MTDRVAAFVVTLERDIRADDVVLIANALRQVRGVLSVAPVVANIETHVAEQRARGDVVERLYALIKEFEGH